MKMKRPRSTKTRMTDRSSKIPAKLGGCLLTRTIAMMSRRSRSSTRTVVGGSGPDLQQQSC